MTRAIRFGIVGTGRMAGDMMAAFRQLPGVEVRAVMSHDSGRAHAFADRHGIGDSLSSLDLLLSRADIDAVYIANANSKHAATSLSALAAGKAVLCEKPFTVSVGEADEVIAAARTHGQVFLESMWTAHLPSFERLFEIVHSGELGEAVHLQADFGYPTDLPVGSTLVAGQGSGVLLDRGVYPVSLAIRLFGPPDEIQACVSRNASGVDVFASLQLRHSGGRQSQLACSFESLLGNSATVACTRGQARVLPPLLGSQAVSWRRMQPLVVRGDAPSEIGVRRRLRQAIGRFPLVQRLRPLLEGRTEIVSYGADRYLPMLRHFISMVRCPDSERLQRDQRISLETMRVIEQAKKTL
jgi:predicted dehydrogenase